jgi:hypothetical protein
VVRDHLSEELIEAGYRLLFVTDVLKMRAQGAMWIYRHELNDWRYYLVTSLVDTIGRRETYKLLLRIFAAPGATGFFPKELTIEDIHLGSPADEYFQKISAAVAGLRLLPPTGKNKATFKDCVINGIKFDGIIYRAVPTSPVSDKEARKIEQGFVQSVQDVEQHGLPA